MKSIKDTIKYEYEIEKSVFITIIKKVYDKDEIDNILSEIKKEYKDANHYCYAYVIDDNKKSSDDKEPGGTAGVPMMEVINHNELNYVIAVVVRYFGGIKLGAGGLTRAYRKAVADAINLNKDKIVELIDGYQISIEVSYDKQKEIEYKYNRILNKKYDINITYDLEVNEEEYNSIKNKYKIVNETRKKIEI